MSNMQTRTQEQHSEPGDGVAAQRTRPSAPAPRRESQETRRSFQSTEFYAMLAAIAGLLVAGYIDSSGLDERMAWQLATLVAIAYIVSRGLAKIGSQKETYDIR